MKLNKVLFGIAFAAITHSVIAAEPAPVIDVSQNNGTGNSLSLKQRVDNLERQFTAYNKKQVTNQQALDELQNELSELRGVTELHTHQLSQILERQRELYQELDRRVTQALKPANNTSVAIDTSTNVTQDNYSSDLTENEAYDQAVNLVLKEKKYDDAIPAFRSFNNNFPNSSYAANAHYWLGQLLFNKNKLNEAKVEFDIVVKNHMTSNKRSDALFKLATVEQKLNNNSQAIKLYQQLVEEFPDSSSAKLAESRLTSLL